MERSAAQHYQRIIDYYKEMSAQYQHGSNRIALAIHAGYQDETVTDYLESLLYMNEVLAQSGQIKSGSVILDAGCGVGGSSIWLAKNRKAKVVGISLVPFQIALAKKFSSEENTEDSVHFLIGDYQLSGFPDGSFDVVWALESSCYSLKKANFICEAYRLLKPGGCLVVADGFQNHPLLTPEEDIVLHSWLDSWEVQSLELVERFFDYLRVTGFKEIKFQDISQNVLPFSIRLYLSAVQSLADARGVSDIRELDEGDLENIRGARDQMRSLIGGSWIYCLFTATKPNVLPAS